MRYLLIILLVVSLAACDKTNEPQSTPEPTPIPEPVPEPNPNPEPEPNPEPTPNPEPDPEPAPEPEPALPSSGSLDKTFGEGGKFVFETEGDTRGDKRGALTAVAVQTDGKIVTAGRGNGLLVTRHNPDGSLDESFDGNGLFLTATGSTATDLAIGQNNTIHALGLVPKTSSAGFPRDCGLHVRFAENQADESLQFCSDADDIIEANVTKDSRDRLISVYLQRAGEEFILTRLRQDGTLDTTGFGDEGVARDANSFFDFSVNLLGVFVRANGDIIVVAQNLIRKNIGVVTYNTSGKFVRSNLLELPQDFRETLVLETAALDNRGRIILAGSLSGNQAALLRFAIFSSALELDTTFDDDGIVIRNEPSETFSDYSDVIVDDKGRVVAVGSQGSASVADSAFLVERYLDDGSLDTSFGSEGHVEVKFTSSRLAGGSSVTLDQSGKIIVAGSAGSFPALARLNP